MIRLAVLGCGAWGQRYIAAARESGVAMVTHVAGSRPQDGVTQVPGFEWRWLLEAPVDAFVVASPPAVHEEQVVAALATGRPVMVEKPIALDVAATCRMLAAAQRHKAPLLVDHVHLFAPAYERMREEVSRWHGFNVASVVGNHGPHRQGYSALWDYGPHDVAMFLGLVGDAPVGDVRAELVGAGHYRLHLRAGAASAAIRVYNDAPPKQRVLGALSAGGSAIVYDDTAEPGHKLVQDGRPIAIDPTPPLTRAVASFARACATGHTDWRYDPILAVNVSKVLERAALQLEE